nr:ribonuclease H-like domain-containing protein [Tanacetum cinerariifolium]
MAIPEDHLAKFHKMTDAKEMWKAIKSRFGGNDESKKMHKYLLKQQFESFSVSNSEGLHKGYDRFQSLLSQLETHGAGVSTEDANRKFLSGPQLDHKDFKHVDEFDLEEMDLKWQEPVGFDKSKVECFNCHNTRHFARECRSKGNQDSRRRDAGNTGYKARDNGKRSAKQDEHKAMVTIDGEGIDWTDTEVTSCSKVCEESYAKLKKLYDEQRKQLSVASIEIQAYTLTLKKIEAQFVYHQKNQLAYEEKIRFMKIDLDDKTNVLIYHKKLLAEAEKEKKELKTKLEDFQSSSKGRSKLLNSQMSAKDKSGLGYGSQIHDGVLSYENEVFASVFDSRSSDVEDSHVNDKFSKVKGMHAVLPHMTGNYMPPKSDFRIDESKFTYGPKQSTTSESDAKTSDLDSYDSNSSVETLESVPKLVTNAPKSVSEPKVLFDAPIIEEYESNSDDEHERMAKQIELNKQKGKSTGPQENRPVWNNVQRLNHQNKFIPTAILTKTGIFSVNAARQKFSSQAASTSTTRKVNTARPKVNAIRPRHNVYKSHSPIRRLLVVLHYRLPVGSDTLYTGSKDETVRVWDLEFGQVDRF